VLIVSEELKTRGRGIEAQQAKRRRGFAALRNVDRESLNGDAALAGSQVREPDEGERHDGGCIAFDGAGDSGPCVLTVFQKGARE